MEIYGNLWKFWAWFYCVQVKVQPAFWIDVLVREHRVNGRQTCFLCMYSEARVEAVSQPGFCDRSNNLPKTSLTS